MYLTDLDARALPGKKWLLLAPLIWDDGTQRVEAEAGFITDLASAPLLDSSDDSRWGAVTHDKLYNTGQLTRAEADRIFLAALREKGISEIMCLVYYAGVRAFAWRTWRRYRKRDAFRAFKDAHADRPDPAAAP